MKNWQNMGGLDRILRAIVGVVLVAVGALAGLSAVWTALAFAVGALMLVTAAVGSCPAYLPFGLSTCAPPRTPKAA